MSEIDVVIIGAGQAGLTCSYQLAERDISHTVLERGQPGHTWSTQRWDTFMLNTMNRFTSMPGMHLDSERPDDFESATAFAQHLSEFALENKLPVREHANVTAVTSTADGRAFQIQLHGEEQQIRCRVVVMASGSQNYPLMPTASRSIPSYIESIHAADYRNPSDLPAGAVLVVGSAQTGVQIVEDLIEAGRETFLSTSKVGRVVRRYRGQDVTHWFQESGFYSHRPSDLENPDEIKAKQPQVSGTKGGHTVSLQGLWRRGVHLLGRLETIDNGVATFRDNLRENMEFGDDVSKMLKTRLDKLLSEKGVELPDDEFDPEDQVDEQALKQSAPTKLDLQDANISVVIWSTGFGGDYSYLEVEEALDPDGFPIHTDGVSPVAGLYVLGPPWTRTRASGIVHGANDDAAAIAGHISGFLSA